MPRLLLHNLLCFARQQHQAHLCGAVQVQDAVQRIQLAFREKDFFR